MNRTTLAIALAISISMLSAACTGTAPGSPAAESPVTEAEARAIAGEMLAAYNDGDYAAWSRHWSQRMKDAIDAEAFGGFRTQAMESAGRFEEIEDVALRPARDRADAVRWEFTSRFTRGAVVFTIVFHTDSTQIEGVDFRTAG